MSHERKITPCCEAINAALAAFSTGVAEELRVGAVLLNTNITDPTARALRTGAALATITTIGTAFRAAISTLINLTCDSPCCESAAAALATAGIAAARNALTGAANPSIPGTGAGDALAAALTASINTFNDTVTLILSTVQCPRKCGCECEEVQKPCRKYVSKSNSRYYQ